jgi:hypothetical protein
MRLLLDECVPKVGDTRPVHEAITYLENHRECLGYPSARRRGLPIGSGNTEATCKSLFTLRLKRCGARWREERAGEVINLRALAACFLSELYHCSSSFLSLARVH